MNCDPCNQSPIFSEDVNYSGPNLVCTTIETCDSMSTAFQKLNSTICSLQSTLVILQNQLNSYTTTTTTTSSTSTTTSTSTSTTSTSTSSTSSTTSTTSSTTTNLTAGIRFKLNVASGGTAQNNVSVWYSISFAAYNGTQPQPPGLSWTLLNSNLFVPVCPTGGVVTSLINVPTVPCIVYFQIIQGGTRTSIYNVGINAVNTSICQTPLAYLYTHSITVNSAIVSILEYPITIKWPLDVVLL